MAVSAREGGSRLILSDSVGSPPVDPDGEDVWTSNFSLASVSAMPEIRLSCSHKLFSIRLVK